MKQEQKGQRINGSVAEATEEKVAPFRTYLFFALVGSSILFLSMVLMFIIWYTHHATNDQFQLPKTFIVSTLTLLFSSYSLSLVHHYFKQDDARKLLIALSCTLLLGGLFTVMQIVSWRSLYQQGWVPGDDASIAFLYIITGLHFMHVGGGLIYLFYLTLKAFDIWNDPVRSLLYFSNHYEGARLSLFSIYWHFIDGLWLFLFLTFLFTL
jgi:cytochrome c oxidase subunit 3